MVQADGLHYQWRPLYAHPAPQPAVVDWSWVRSVLAQGADIHQDYMAGRHATYEHYSARLDVAAHERVKQVAQPAQKVDAALALLRDDAYAATFRTLGQYRAAVIAALGGDVRG